MSKSASHKASRKRSSGAPTRGRRKSTSNALSAKKRAVQAQKVQKHKLSDSLQAEHFRIIKQEECAQSTGMLKDMTERVEHCQLITMLAQHARPSLSPGFSTTCTRASSSDYNGPWGLEAEVFGGELSDLDESECESGARRSCSPVDASRPLNPHPSAVGISTSTVHHFAAKPEAPPSISDDLDLLNPFTDSVDSVSEAQILDAQEWGLNSINNSIGESVYQLISDVETLAGSTQRAGPRPNWVMDLVRDHPLHALVDRIQREKNDVSLCAEPLIRDICIRFLNSRVFSGSVVSLAALEFSNRGHLFPIFEELNINVKEREPWRSAQRHRAISAKALSLAQEEIEAVAHKEAHGLRDQIEIALSYCYARYVQWESIRAAICNHDLVISLSSIIRNSLRLADTLRTEAVSARFSVTVPANSYPGQQPTRFDSQHMAPAWPQDHKPKTSHCVLSCFSLGMDKELEDGLIDRVVLPEVVTSAIMKNLKSKVRSAVLARALRK